MKRGRVKTKEEEEYLEVNIYEGTFTIIITGASPFSL